MSKDIITKNDIAIQIILEMIADKSKINISQMILCKFIDMFDRLPTPEETKEISNLISDTFCDIYTTDPPFYVYEVYRRLCGEGWECDWCEWCAEEDDIEEDEINGRICPTNLWWYVIQRNKVMEKFMHE